MCFNCWWYLQNKIYLLRTYKRGEKMVCKQHLHANSFNVFSIKPERDREACEYSGVQTRGSPITVLMGQPFSCNGVVSRHLPSVPLCTPPYHSIQRGRSDTSLTDFRLWGSAENTNKPVRLNVNHCYRIAWQQNGCNK